MEGSKGPERMSRELDEGGKRLGEVFAKINFFASSLRVCGDTASECFVSSWRNYTILYHLSYKAKSCFLSNKHMVFFVVLACH